MIGSSLFHDFLSLKALFFFLLTLNASYIQKIDEIVTCKYSPSSLAQCYSPFLHENTDGDQLLLALLEHLTKLQVSYELMIVVIDALDVWLNVTSSSETCQNL